MLADQFQRNGVIFGLRFDVPNGDTSAVSRGGGSGFSGTFEIVAAAKAGVVGRKRRPNCAGDVDCRPRWPLATLAARSATCHPYPPKGRRGQGTLRCASKVAATSSRPRPNTAIAVGERNSRCFGTGSLFIKRAQPNASLFIDSRGCRSMPPSRMHWATRPRHTRPVCRQTSDRGSADRAGAISAILGVSGADAARQAHLLCNARSRP